MLLSPGRFAGLLLLGGQRQGCELHRSGDSSLYFDDSGTCQKSLHRAAEFPAWAVCCSSTSVGISLDVAGGGSRLSGRTRSGGMLAGGGGGGGARLPAAAVLRVGLWAVLHGCLVLATLKYLADMRKLGQDLYFLYYQVASMELPTGRPLCLRDLESYLAQPAGQPMPAASACHPSLMRGCSSFLASVPCSPYSPGPLQP